MTRYEYIVFSLPITFFLFYQNPRPYIRLINIASSFLLTTAIIFSQLFPLQSFFSFLLYQLHGLFLKGIILVILTVIVFVLIRSMSLLKKKVVSYSSQAVIIFLWILIGLMLLSSFFSILSQYIPINLSFFRKFFFHDFVICTFSCVGLMFFLRKREYKVYGFFVILSCLLLGYVYYQVNPEMDRYMTHLLPFLLIPASYTLMLTYRKAYALLVSRQYVKGGGIVTALFCLIFLQGILTMYGLRYLHDTSWYHTSYETIAATKVKPYVTSDSIILVSLPEPYYYTLHISTQSITDTYPFVYIPKSLDNNTILVVDDMGMHTVFPHFEKFISQYLSPYTVTQFWVHEKFHYVNQSYKEKYPVTIYRIKLKQLKQLIHQNNLIK